MELRYEAMEEGKKPSSAFATRLWISGWAFLHRLLRTGGVSMRRCGVDAMRTSSECDVRGPEPERSERPGLHSFWMICRAATEVDRDYVLFFAGPRTLDVVSFVSGDRRLNVLINPGQPSHRQAVKRCCVEKLQGSRVVFYLSTSTAPFRSPELDSNVVSWPGGRLDAWPARAVDAMLAEAGCYPIKRATLGPWLPRDQNQFTRLVCLSLFPIQSPAITHPLQMLPQQPRGSSTLSGGRPKKKNGNSTYTALRMAFTTQAPSSLLTALRDGAEPRASVKA